MPVYEYVVLDQRGKYQKGILDADSPAVARQRLRSKGLYLVEIKETKGQRAKDKGKWSFGLKSGLFLRVRSQEVYSTTRLLATLLSSGLPLDVALNNIILQLPNPAFKKILAQVKDSVSEGNSLAYALSQHPKVFSPLYINMVRSGEASGSLDLVLTRLADYGEQQQILINKIRAALAYPIFMSVVGSLVLVFLVSFVVPNITKIFDQIQKSLPLPTVILIFVSNFMERAWWMVLSGLILLILAFRWTKDHQKVRALIDLLKLRLPLIGNIHQRLMLARFARTLGNLLSAGVPMIQGLQISSNIIQNVHIKKVVEEAQEEVEAGRSLARALSKSPYFQPMLLQMIEIGEQSGTLENMLQKCADTYEREIESSISALTSMLEPVLILLMGLIVGFIVIAILLPIFEMNQLVR